MPDSALCRPGFQVWSRLMADPEETEAESREARPRRKLVMTLTVIAVLVGFLSIMSTLVLRQTLETDTWAETSA